MLRFPCVATLSSIPLKFIDPGTRGGRFIPEKNQTLLHVRYSRHGFQANRPECKAPKTIQRNEEEEKMFTRYKLLIAAIAVVLLGACGSGGGGGGGGSSASTTTTPSSATSYTAAAAIGELLTYTLDTTNLTYSYTITESQYGLTGKTGSGTLTKNSNGTYTPSDAPNARVAILPNGLLVGGIRETINGVSRTIPIMGMSNPVSSLSGVAGTYNYVSVGCATTCGTGYGTFRINGDGTWVECTASNYDAAPDTCAGRDSGTFNSLGSGKWQILHFGTDIGTAFVFTSGSQNVAVIDLKDNRAGGFGRGMLVGATKTAATTANGNGTWNYNSFNGTSGSIIVTNTTYTDSYTNYQTAYTLSINSPWDGLITPQVGGRALLAGTGVYVYENAGYFSVGLKQ